MKFERRLQKIADLLAAGKLFIGDGYRAKNEELGSSGFPFARAGNIDDGFHFEEADCLLEKNLPRVGNKISQPGDVVFTSKGTVGRFAFVRNETIRFIYSPQLCFWRSLDLNTIDARFLYYWMCGREFFLQYKSVAGQTDMAEYVSLADQRRMHITLPGVAEQRAIAQILGTLDEKIDLNRQMNETLEAMASAIFKSWFVDFDPVFAKIKSRNTDLPKPLSDLFPNTYQDSPKGQIPLGWEIDTIKDRASAIQYGLTESASEEPIGPRFLRITDIQGGRVDWSQVPFCSVADDKIDKYRISDGDIFVARTGASTGENIYIVNPPKAVFASYLVRFRFNDRGTARVVGEFMRTPDYFDFIQGCIGGSAQPNASAQTLASAEFAFPPTEIAGAFYEYLGPLDQQRAMNARQSVTLAKIRDALLPKLLSGEICVRDTENAVGAVV